MNIYTYPLQIFLSSGGWYYLHMSIGGLPLMAHSCVWTFLICKLHNLLFLPIRAYCHFLYVPCRICNNCPFWYMSVWHTFIAGCPIVAQSLCMTLLYMSIAGYPIIAHSGQLVSYWADLNIIPSKGIGAFVSNNGLADPSVPLKFALDVLNGEEPWLNASTVCTYPQPWQPPPDVPVPDINMTIGEPARKLSAYTGTFKQPVFGKITVYKATNQTLKIQYGMLGDINLTPLAIPDVFLAQGSGIVWYAPLGIVNFTSSSQRNVIDTLQFPALEMLEPPVFKRSWWP